MPLLIQVVLFGYAANFRVNHVATVVLDLDRSQASRELVSHFTANGRFDVVDVAANDAQVTRDIDAGRAVVAIVIHAGFARDLGNGKTAPLEVAVDGTNSNTALIALGYVSLIVAQFQADAMAKAWPAAAGAAAPSIAVALQDRPWFNDELNDHWFFIPGVIGTLTLLQVVSLTAFAVVREREVGTLEQIMVSPIRPIEFILGKTVPFFLIGLGDVTSGHRLRRAVVRHSVHRQSVGHAVGSLAVSAGGARVRADAVDVFAHPAAGVCLDLHSGEPAVHSFRASPIRSPPCPLCCDGSRLINPLRYFLVVIRAVLLKGVGLDVLWQPLIGDGTARVGHADRSSVLRFRKSMD